MFDQLKDLNNLRKQAGEMEKQLATVVISATSNDQSVAVTLNGKQDILSVKIAEGIALKRESLETAFQQAYESAQKQLQKILAEKFKGMM